MSIKLQNQSKNCVTFTDPINGDYGSQYTATTLIPLSSTDAISFTGSGYDFSLPTIGQQRLKKIIIVLYEAKLSTTSDILIYFTIAGGMVGAYDSRSTAFAAGSSATTSTAGINVRAQGEAVTATIIIEQFDYANINNAGGWISTHAGKRTTAGVSGVAEVTIPTQYIDVSGIRITAATTGVFTQATMNAYFYYGSNVQ